MIFLLKTNFGSFAKIFFTVIFLYICFLSSGIAQESAKKELDDNKTKFEKWFEKWYSETLYIPFLSLEKDRLLPSEIFDDPKTLEFILGIKNNDIVKMKELVKEGVNINTKGKYNITPLMCAFRSSEKCFRWLLDNGADPNCEYRTEDGATVPLLFSAIEHYKQYRDIFYLRLLLEYKTNVNALAMVSNIPKRRFPPIYAIFQSHYSYSSLKDTQALELLIKAGADINPPDFNYLFEARSFAQILCLLENGANESRQCAGFPLESFITAFIRNHSTMDGFFKENYIKYIDRYIEKFSREVSHYTKAQYYQIMIQEWDCYWKIVDLLRKKGYDLKNEEESRKCTPTNKVPVIFNVLNITRP